MRSGRLSNPIVWANGAIRGRPAATDASSSKRFCGSLVPALPGATFPTNLVTGTQFSSVFAAGSSAEPSSASSSFFPKMPTLNMSWWTEPSFVCIVTDKGQKGDSKSIDRQEPRRIDDQDPGAGRCLGQPCALPSYARTARGNDRRGGLA